MMMDAEDLITELQVAGMSCDGCGRRVSNALKNLTGVGKVEVSLERKQVRVHWHSSAAMSVAVLVKAVETAGYKVEPHKIKAIAPAGA
jgi:copper chaperone CopZ